MPTSYVLMPIGEGHGGCDQYGNMAASLILTIKHANLINRLLIEIMDFEQCALHPPPHVANLAMYQYHRFVLDR